MTIVARGAALFAASQRVPQIRSSRPGKGTLRLKLAYSPVSQDTETDVAGKLEDAGDFSHARVEISRVDGGWNSGKLALTNNAFMASVVLNDRTVNEFQIRMFDKTGNALRVEPENFAITHGPMVEDAPLSQGDLAGTKRQYDPCVDSKGGNGSLPGQDEAGRNRDGARGLQRRNDRRSKYSIAPR